MTVPKIEPYRLNELIAEGKTNAQISRIFHCSRPAVTKAKRKLGLAVVGSIIDPNAEENVDGDPLGLGLFDDETGDSSQAEQEYQALQERYQNRDASTSGYTTVAPIVIRDAGGATGMVIN
jgi:hypothetical protein